MDLASLKNLDVKDLVSKLKGADLLSNKKLLIKFGVGFGSIIIFLIIYYAFVSPIVKSQNEQIALMTENKMKIEEFQTNIITLKKSIKEKEPEFKKNSKLFHSKKEVEDLYQNISNFALSNGLSIVNLKKGEPVAVGNNNSGENTSSDQNSENTVTIFNRWGDILQTINNYDNVNNYWDGKNNNNQYLPAGTYFFTIEVPGNNIRCSNWVQIVKEN